MIYSSENPIAAKGTKCAKQLQKIYLFVNLLFLVILYSFMCFFAANDLSCSCFSIQLQSFDSEDALYLIVINRLAELAESEITL